MFYMEIRMDQYFFFVLVGTYLKRQSVLCYRYNFFNFFKKDKKVKIPKKNGLPDTVSGGAFSRLKSSSQLFFGLIRASSRPNINGDVGGY